VALHTRWFSLRARISPNTRIVPGLFTRWALAALLFTGMFVCYAQRGALAVAAPFLVRDLHMSPMIMGMLLSAFFWSYALMQVPAGWLVDHLGARRTYGWGMLLCAAASGLTGMASSLSALTLWRVLLGGGQAVAFPASSRAVANWFSDHQRGIATGLYLTGVRFGQAAAGAAAVVLLPRYGWQMLFFVTGLAALLWVPLWLIFLRRWQLRESALAVSSEPRIGLLRSFALLQHRSVLGIFLGFFAYDYAWYLYTSWLPGYLRMERHVSAVDMGIYSSVPFVVMAAIILLSGFFSDEMIRRGFREVTVRKAFVIVGLAIGCLVVPVGLVRDNRTAVWLITLSLCGLGISAPNTWTLTQAVCTKQMVGTVSGIQNFGGNLGGILAPVLTGYIVHRTHSFSLALDVTGGILVIGMAAYAILIRARVEPSA
jgi:ACS family glucarate transporter-like MFS transporter